MWSALGNMFGRRPAIREVHVHFEKRKLRVSLGPEDYDAQKQVPLRGFRAKLAGALRVPPRELTLYQVDPQRKLSNMAATLEDYGLGDGSDVLAVHVRPEPPQAPAPAQASPTQRIDAVVASLESELGERIARLINEGPPADAEQRETEHRVLSEIVLAKTIALDDVEVSTPEERQHRKNAIARMQQYHKDIDAAIARPPRQEDAPAAAAKQSAKQPAKQPTQESAPQTTQTAAAGQEEPAKQAASASASPSASPSPSNSNSASASASASGSSKSRKKKSKKKGKR